MRRRPDQEPVMMPDPIALAVVAATPGRFKGRLELERQARSQHVADRVVPFRELCRKLGLSGLGTPAPREISKKVVQAERKAYKEPSDPLASRKPGNVRERFAAIVVRRAYDAAKFRRATHCHTTSFQLSEYPGAHSESGRDWPNKVGAKLPQSYKYRVATSEHFIYYNADILRAPRSTPGRLWLAPGVCIVQSRGTGLRCK